MERDNHLEAAMDQLTGLKSTTSFTGWRAEVLLCCAYSEFKRPRKYHFVLCGAVLATQCFNHLFNADVRFAVVVPSYFHASGTESASSCQEIAVTKLPRSPLSGMLSLSGTN